MSEGRHIAGSGDGGRIMNLTNALETLIDAARQLPETPHLKQAIRAVEKKVDRLREKKGLRDRASQILDSVAEADREFPNCPMAPYGNHDWRFVHAAADYLACDCFRCHKRMRLSPAANPVPEFLYDSRNQ